MGLITNGSIFLENNIYRLIDAGVGMIEFSVDAYNKESYIKLDQDLIGIFF